MAKKDKKPKPTSKETYVGKESAENSLTPLGTIVAANLGLIGFFLITFSALTFPPVIPCSNPFTQNLILSVLALFGLHFFSPTLKEIAIKGIKVNLEDFFRIIGTEVIRQSYRTSLAIAVLLMAIVMWLGSYTLSPFYYSTGRIPILRGFVVTTSSSSSSTIRPGESFEISNSAWATIDPEVQPAETRCSWSSARKGSFDNSHECNVVYYPPLGFTEDLLQLEIRSRCQPQEFHGHLRVIILP